MNEENDVPKVVRLLQAISMGHKTIDSVKNDASKFGLEPNIVYNTVKNAERLQYIDWKSWKYDKRLVLTEKGIERLKYKNKNFRIPQYMPKCTYINHLLDIINSFKYPVSKAIIQSHYVYENFNYIFNYGVHRRYVKNINGKYVLTNLGLQRLKATNKRLDFVDKVYEIYNICK